MAIFCLILISCNSLPGYKFTQNYTQINQEFNDIYKYETTEFVSGMRLEITGFVNGEGTLLIIHPPYDTGSAIQFDLSGRINKQINRMDWYESECLIKFIPNDSTVNGIISVNLVIY